MLKTVYLFCAMLLLEGCGSMFDIAGKGSKDKKIFYDVATNRIISNYKSPISSFYTWKHKKDSTRWYERTAMDTATNIIVIPELKDSIAYYGYQISLHLQDDHWRMMYHIDITQALVQKKKKIYSRFTSH